MYSIVLMAATAAGPNTPASDHSPAVVAPVAVGCCGGAVVAGCTGCTGYVAGCYGSCYGARVSVFHRHKHSCYGCYGSCTGWSCFGSCYGFWGSCYGSYSYGCGGSCYGSYSYGYGYGCAGSCYGAYNYHYGCSGTGYGLGHGGYVAPPAGIMVAPASPAPAVTNPMPKTDPLPKTDPMPKKDGASLRFQLPPNAVLYVDGQRAAGTGADRAFYTPPLQAGQRYFYDVKAELVVNGQTVTEEKRVIVTAGAELVESFPRLFAAVADPTTVAGR